MIWLIGCIAYQSVVGESQSVYRTGEENRIVKQVEGVVCNPDITVVWVLLFRCWYFRINADYGFTELVK